MITVLGDRVLVALPPREEEIVSAGGIVLVKDPDRFHTPTRGIVVALGDKADVVSLADVVERITDTFDGALTPPEVSDLVDDLKRLRPAPFDVECGDMVIFPRSAGDQIHDGGVDYVVLRESEIIGIVEPKESAA